METFDFIIAGSGLGGLACGYILAKEGYSVCILEKNRQYGGNLQTFARDKSVFDTGVHYLGGLDEGQNLNRYFTYLGIMKDLRIARMDENGFDRITFKGDPVEYPHAMGYDNFARRLKDLFPRSGAEIDAYCNTIIGVCDSLPLYRLRDADPGDVQLKYVTRNACEFMHETISDPKLRNVLSGSIMLYGGDRYTSSLYQHAVTVNTYIESSWKCIDGGSQITKSLIRSIRAMGGELMNYAEIVSLHVEDGKVTHALLEDGRKIFGKKFISNIHPALTMDLIEKGKIREGYRERMKHLKNSISVFSLHLVFHPESFPYLNYNYYHTDAPDVWDTVRYKPGEWPNSYMAITPATSRSDVYADSMTIMAYMHMQDVEKWADTFNVIPNKETSRGDDYEAFKEACAQKLLAKLEEKFPGIRRAIRSYHTSTPLSYRDYIATPEGSMYGIIKDYNRPLETMLSYKTKLPNLYLTGQNLNTHGILGVTVSAVKTASEFTGGHNRLMKKIRESSGS